MHAYNADLPCRPKKITLNKAKDGYKMTENYIRKNNRTGKKKKSDNTLTNRKFVRADIVLGHVVLAHLAAST